MRRRAFACVLAVSVGVLVATAAPAEAAVTVASFSPTSGPVGTSVTITGTGFSASGSKCAALTIQFNAVNAKCTYVSNTSIKTAVPAGATSGPLTVNGVSASSNPNFTVTLGISMTPAVGPPTSSVTITGSGYDPYSAIDVYFDTSDQLLLVADANGNFGPATLTIPASATPGTHWISAIERGSNPKGAQQSFRVAASWNQGGVNAAHTGVNRYENQLTPQTVSGLDEAWTAPGGSTYAGAPAIDGAAGPHGLVYVPSSAAGPIMAVDAQTGAPVWSGTGIGGVGYASAAVSGTRVFVTAGGAVLSFATTCKSSACSPVAQTAAGYLVSSAPTVSAGAVYVGDNQFGLDAFPTTCSGTCSATWTGDANGAISGGDGAPAVSGSGLVFEQVGGTSPYPARMLAAYSPRSCSSGSCAPVWYATTTAANLSTPAVANGIVYVNPGDGHLYAYRAGGCAASPCAPLWSFGLGVYYNGSPAIYDGVVYIPGEISGSPNTYWLFALDASTGALIWKGQLSSFTGESVPAVAGGVVYVNANDSSTSGELFAFPTACSAVCSPIWHAIDSATGYASPPVVVNGTVYDASGDGSLYAYDLNPPDVQVRPRLATLRPNLRLRAQGSPRR